MKRILFATVALFISIIAFGQGRYGADSAECIKYLSFYMQYMKQDNMEDAAPNWRKAIHFCPPTASPYPQERAGRYTDDASQDEN